MRPIPTRAVRKLISEMADASRDIPTLGFELIVEGEFGVAKEGSSEGALDLELGIGAIVPSSLPVDVDVETGVAKTWERESNRIGFGRWKVRVWRDPSR